MKMLRLLPSDLTLPIWNLVRKGLERGLAPLAEEGPGALARVYQGCLRDEFQVWLGENERGLALGALTTFTRDGGTGVEYVLIYALWNYFDLRLAEARECLEALKGFAEKTGCSGGVVAYVNDPRFARVLREHLGADTSWTLVKFSMNGGAQK